MENNNLFYKKLTFIIILSLFLKIIFNIPMLIIFIPLSLLTWFFNDNNIYRTTMIVGKKGCGKSTDIAKRSLYYQRKGYKVYSNIEIPGNYLFNPADMSTFKFEENSVIFLDEVGLIYDARNYRNFESGLNVLYKYFRQYKNIVFLYSQAYGSDLDLKIKNVIDDIIIMQRIGKISILKPVAKIVDIGNREGEGGNIIFSFKYQSILNWKFNYIPRYLPFFKSYNPPERDVINSVNIAYSDFQKIASDNKKYAFYLVKTSFDNFIQHFKLLLYKLPFLKVFKYFRK